MNILRINFVDRVKKGKRLFFWTTLETENETRQCCYELIGKEWIWCDGNNEPKLSLPLEALFHGEQGNIALTHCCNSEIPITLTA